MSQNTSIGAEIRRLRTGQKLTLKQLGADAELSAAYISQIENDKASPSIATLKRIAQVLGVRIVDFFIGDVKDEPVVLTPDQWVGVSLQGWRADIRQLVRTVAQKQMQPFYTVIEPGGGSREAYSHAGEEFGLVIEGELTITVGEAVHTVKAGSSFYYSSLLLHSWTNEGREPCTVVWVVSPPTW